MNDDDQADNFLRKVTDPLHVPDGVGVGGGSCRCGVVTLSNVQASWAASMFFECPNCGDAVEVMAQKGEP